VLRVGGRGRYLYVLPDDNAPPPPRLLIQNKEYLHIVVLHCDDICETQTASKTHDFLVLNMENSPAA
jgi:hypothetical protein